jgi:hypothetical protein
VPNVGPIHVFSEFETSATDFNRVGAIFGAIDILGFGDVMVIENQTHICITWVTNAVGDPQCQNEVAAPVEIEELVYKSLRLATALGIVVVEPTGNGSRDLDAMVDIAGKKTLDPATPAEFRDSGAILVGGSEPEAVGRKKAAASSYGLRVNCFARAEYVTCTNAAGATGAFFGGTSAASAIVAGAAVAVQGMASNALGFRLGPLQMRALLGDVGINTESGDASAYLIGMMPNLDEIATRLGVAVDLYARDQVGDSGDPSSGAAYKSPDVILLPSSVASGQTAFGETSGTASDETLGSDVAAGSTPVIYVRVRNRGMVPATNATAAVFWSLPSTLVSPDAWTPIGIATLASVPAGDELTVFPPIAWAAGTPAPGHYCLVAVIGCDQDPAPPTADFGIIDRFARFVRENNNVVWRNINVLAPEPVPASGSAERSSRGRRDRGSAEPEKSRYRMSFAVAGAPDRRARMRLEVVGRLPKGAVGKLSIPKTFGDAIVFRESALPRPKSGKGTVLEFDPNGATNVGDFVLDARKRVTLTLEITVAAPRGRQRYEMFARQLFLGEEVGRVTWLLRGPSTKEKAPARPRQRSRSASRKPARKGSKSSGRRKGK